MQIVQEDLKTGYVIHTKKNGKVLLCKILNDYDNAQDANDDMNKLLTNQKTEEDILKEFTKKGF